MAEARRSQANPPAYPVKVKKEDTSFQDGHCHEFFYQAGAKLEEKSVTCMVPGTVLEALQRSDYLKGNEVAVGQYPIIKMGKTDNSSAIATHFPCHLIGGGKTLIISFEPKEVENVAQTQPCAPQGTSYVTFLVNTEGGINTKTKPLFVNPVVKKKFKSVRVYAAKGTTVRDALKRDGRFCDYITDNFTLYDTLSEVKRSVDCDQFVDNHDGKHFDICIPVGKVRGDQGSAASSLSATGTKAKMSTNTRPKANRREPENQTQTEDREEVFEQLRKQFPALKKWMLSRFPDNTFQDAVESKRGEFGEIQQAFLEAHRLRQFLELGNSVCQLKVKGVKLKDDTNVEIFGTGFVLFDHFILTNAHLFKDCVQESVAGQWQVTSEVEATFNFEKPSSEMNVLKANNIIGHYNNDQTLDYVILELDQTESIPEGLLSKCGPVPKSGGVCIIGHPNGQKKRLGLTCVIEPERREETVAGELTTRYKDNFLVLWEIMNNLMEQRIDNIMKGRDKEEKVVTYKTNMYHGSSGSPVFDDEGCVFGLHTAGFVYDHRLINDEANAIGVAYSLTLIIDHLWEILQATGQEQLKTRLEDEVKKNAFLYNHFCKKLQIPVVSDESQ